MLGAGVDIGGSYIKAGLVEIQSGRIIDQCSVPFPRGQRAEVVWDRTANCVTELVDRQRLMMNDLVSVGVALPGTLNPEKTQVIHAYNLDFHNTEVRRPLEERFPGIPLSLLNDGDAATLAEHRFGVLKGTRTAVLLTLGTGVGGGLILNGQLFGGGLGNGVEIGHMTLRYDAGKHVCGNPGCVEMYCSASSLVSGLEGVSPREVIEGIRNEDPAMFGILERYTDALSSALVSIVNLLDPEVIALGGGVSNAGEPLLEATSRKLREKSFFTAEYRIVQASMGNEAGMVGAAIAHQCL